MKQEMSNIEKAYEHIDSLCIAEKLRLLNVIMGYLLIKYDGPIGFREEGDSGIYWRSLGELLAYKGMNEKYLKEVHPKDFAEMKGSS